MHVFYVWFVVLSFFNLCRDFVIITDNADESAFRFRDLLSDVPIMLATSEVKHNVELLVISFKCLRPVVIMIVECHIGTE